MAITHYTRQSRFSALLPLLGTASALIALLLVGFAIGGTAMMLMM